jgi:hypothetical protein
MVIMFIMKRTCLPQNTNTDEKKTCEFHPTEIKFNEQFFDPKDNQLVKSSIRMKSNNKRKLKAKTKSQYLRA